MMREPAINRLSNVDINLSDANYLVYSSFHKVLKSAIATYAFGNLLDIGCGNKPYEVFLKNHITNYFGCDIIQSSQNKVDVICPANDIPLGSDSFDTVLCTQTIEHVEDYQGLVNEAYRLLRPGGHFILTGPLYWPLHEEPYDFFRFTKHGFKYILEKANFQVLEINSNGGKWALAGQALIHAFEDSVARTIFNRIILSLYHRYKGRNIINRLFSSLDKEIYCESNTMNYVVVCKK